MRRINTPDQIARDLFALMREAVDSAAGRPSARLLHDEFDHLPSDVRAGWHAVARYVGSAFG